MNLQEMVTEFHRTFGFSMSEEPRMLNDSRFSRTIKWMKEEIDELETADNLVDQIDALTDLAYFIIGFFVTIGVDFETMFRIVHEANMRKAVKRVRYDDDGKIIKPVNWLPPESEIAMEIDRVKAEIKRRRDVDDMDELLEKL